MERDGRKVVSGKNGCSQKAPENREITNKRLWFWVVAPPHPRSWERGCACGKKRRLHGVAKGHKMVPARCGGGLDNYPLSTEKRENRFKNGRLILYINMDALV